MKLSSGAASPYLYLLTTHDNRIIIGERDEEFFSHIKQDKLIPGKTRQFQKDFSKIFPSISFNPEFNWAGVFGSTKDGLPYIGTYKKLPIIKLPEAFKYVLDFKVLFKPANL